MLNSYGKNNCSSHIYIIKNKNFLEPECWLLSEENAYYSHLPQQVSLLKLMVDELIIVLPRCCVASCNNGYCGESPGIDNVIRWPELLPFQEVHGAGPFPALHRDP